MSFETISNISRPIETENRQEQQAALFEKIEQISLLYADKIYQEKKRENPSYKFSQTLQDFTPTENIIMRPVFHLEGFDSRKYQEQIKNYFNDCYSEIDSVYSANVSDIDKIASLVSMKRDGLITYLGLDDAQEFRPQSKERPTKVLSFNPVTNIEVDAEKKYQDLKNLGFSQFDHFIEIHVEDFYSTDADYFGPELIKNDLGALAEYIVDKEPETAAVVGKSWLLDTPLAERLGFLSIPGEKTKQNDFSVWLQFIDKNGQIDRTRFNEFLQTGKLPYESVKAYMPIENFLQRYLPVDRRGPIKLREVNQENKAYWAKLQLESESIKVEWDNLLDARRGFESFVAGNKSLNEVLSLVSPEEKREYVNFLQAMYNNGISWRDMHEHKNESIKAIDGKINQTMKDSLYKDKDVFIE